MTPNLLVWAQTVVDPRRWLSRHTTEPVTEHWCEPVPGTYCYEPNSGWCLHSIDEDFESSLVAMSLPRKELPSLPHHVIYSRVLKRYLLQCEYLSRRQLAYLPGRAAEVALFRLDDGVAWVMFEDEKGRFNPGPWELFCVDKGTKQFRPMLKGDDPVRQSKKDTPVSSPDASRRGSVQPCIAACQDFDTAVNSEAYENRLIAKLDGTGERQHSRRNSPASCTLSASDSELTSSTVTTRSSFEVIRA